jgi:O-antigen/teichoic acid export membrane protein
VSARRFGGRRTNGAGADRSAAGSQVESDSRHHLGQLARGGALNLAGAGVSAVAGFTLTLLVTNGFDEHTAGVFFAATTAFTLLASVATLGTETGLGRFMLRYELLDRRPDIAVALRTAFVPTVLVSVAAAVALFVLAPEAAAVIGADGDDGATVVRLLAVVLPIVTLNNLALSGTRAFGRMRETVLLDSVFRSVAQPVAALAVSLAGAGLVALTLGWALPYVLAAVASLAVFHRFLRRRRLLERGGMPADVRAVRREFWAFTWPRAITKLSQLTIQRIDIVLVAALRSPQEAAVYTAATRFVTLAQFGSQAIQNVLQPKLTALIAAEERAVLKQVFKTASAWSMAVTWPVYLVVAGAPLAYLGLFGSAYTEDATAIVLVMAAAMLFAVATGPQDTLLLMSGRSGLSLVNAVVALVVNLVLAFLLIPGLGMLGAAVARGVAVVLRALLTMLQVGRTMDVVSFGKPAGIVAAAGLGCVALPLAVLSLTVDLDLPLLLLALAVLTPLYLAVLWWAREPLMLTSWRSMVRRGPKTG